MRILYISQTKLVLVFFLVGAFIFVGWEVGIFSQPGEVIQTVEPIYQGYDDRKEIALTFNVDWGEEVIPSILDTLSEEDIQATFFVTGRFASKFPEVVENIAEKGHEIGNHGYSHYHPNRSSSDKNKEEILSTEEELEKIVASVSPLYAPPYGECNPKVVEAADDLGYKTIMWTIDTVDWKEGKTADSIKNKVISKATNGAIVLMHPRQATSKALPLIIEELREKGYDFQKVSEIIPSSNSQNK